MPADVAARLDEVLAGLRDDPAERPARHARRLLPRAGRRVVPRPHAGAGRPRLLVAAAAVVVGGVGVARTSAAAPTSASSSAAERRGRRTAARRPSSHPSRTEPPRRAGGDLRCGRRSPEVRRSALSDDALPGSAAWRTPARAASTRSVRRCLRLGCGTRRPGAAGARPARAGGSGVHGPGGSRSSTSYVVRRPPPRSARHVDRLHRRRLIRTRRLGA